MYGFKFNENMKFLKALSSDQNKLSNQLHLRVNYGAGTVNDHGVQLFIFDRKGRLAALCDNDQWSVNDVKKCLITLIAEN